MEEEWRIFLKENAPKLYEEMLYSVMWQAKWRDEKIATLKAENAELAKLLTEGCNGFGSVLIQTSDMAGVNNWRKRVKEYLLITKHRSK